MRDLTKCPKCGSERIAFAEEEAPAWAKQWTKCFACGKRWNLGGPPPKVTDDESEPDPVPTKRTGDDIVNLVMSLSRQGKPGPKVEPSETKETTMGKWSAEARERHKKTMADIHAKKRAGGGIAPTAVSGPVKVKRKYTFKTRKSAGEPLAPVAQLPAKRANAPIVLADPTIINPTPIGNGHGPAAIDDLIGKFETDLATLRRAKELLEQHG